MTRTALITALFGGTSLLALPAAALPLDIESEIEAATVIGLLDEDASDAEDILYEITLDTEAETILKNGTVLGARLTLRGQRDHPDRPGFAGRFDTGAPLAGGYSGLSGLAPDEETGARGRLETAYLVADGGYGELRLGKDRGVAARFHEGGPTSLVFSGVSNPYLDPTGLKINRTNHDVTGPSVKLSYATPRILGLRAGASFTPDGDGRHLDRSLSQFREQPGLSDVFEVAANLSRTLRSSGTRIEASLGWSSAKIDSPAPGARGRMETWSAGANVEFSEFSVGASWLGSDNGFQGGDYEAWEAGIARDFGETEVSLGYGEADDNLARLSSKGFNIAAARELSDGFDVALSYQDEKLDTPAGERSGAGIVVEITLSSDFFRMSRN
ncbi:porin [Henriciella sp.]|uniref:porin n=1 Tax=Henriciella sp. TaxID=1968823 RepID=UPI0025B87ADA|nr:porin [Henriciella sp.]